MERRKHDANWEVRESFETTRVGQQCLIDAYARLLPIHRRSPQKSDHKSRASPAVTAPKLRGKHV